MKTMRRITVLGALLIAVLIVSGCYTVVKTTSHPSTGHRAVVTRQALDEPVEQEPEENVVYVDENGDEVDPDNVYVDENGELVYVKDGDSAGWGLRTEKYIYEDEDGTTNVINNYYEGDYDPWSYNYGNYGWNRGRYNSRWSYNDPWYWNSYPYYGGYASYGWSPWSSYYGHYNDWWYCGTYGYPYNNWAYSYPYYGNHHYGGYGNHYGGGGGSDSNIRKAGRRSDRMWGVATGTISRSGAAGATKRTTDSGAVTRAGRRTSSRDGAPTRKATTIRGTSGTVERSARRTNTRTTTVRRATPASSPPAVERKTRRTSTSRPATSETRKSTVGQSLDPGHPVAIRRSSSARLDDQTNGQTTIRRTARVRTISGSEYLTRARRGARTGLAARTSSTRGTSTRSTSTQTRSTRSTTRSGSSYRPAPSSSTRSSGTSSRSSSTRSAPRSSGFSTRGTISGGSSGRSSGGSSGRSSGGSSGRSSGGSSGRSSGGSSGGRSGRR